MFDQYLMFSQTGQAMQTCTGFANWQAVHWGTKICTHCCLLVGNHPKPFEFFKLHFEEATMNKVGMGRFPIWGVCPFWRLHK